MAMVNRCESSESSSRTVLPIPAPMWRCTESVPGDTGINRASKINNLLISLKQGFFGTVGDSYVDSVC